MMKGGRGRAGSRLRGDFLPGLVLWLRASGTGDSRGPGMKEEGTCFPYSLSSLLFLTLEKYL